MDNFNCIIILNKERNRLLFCKRMNDPYKGLFNFVGGKIEKGEDSLHAAYRELYEETGITDKDITLYPFMDYVWHFQQIRMEVYVGVLKNEVKLCNEKHPLCWLDMSQDFFDMTVFAGEGNIGHMIEILKMTQLPE